MIPKRSFLLRPAVPVGAGLLALLLGTQSCRPVYGPAIAGSDVAFLAKPAYQGQSASATYASGRLGVGAIYNSSESNLFGQAGLHRSHTFRHACLSYGGFGYAGDYNVQRVKSYSGHKFYYGGGLQAGLSLNISGPKTDFRPIGLQATISQEGGRFRQFRTEAALQDSIYDFSDRQGLVSLTAVSELLFKLDSSQTITLQLGYNFGHWRGGQAAFGWSRGRTNLWLQGNLFFYPAELGPTPGFDLIATFSGGLAYRLGPRRAY